MGARIDYVMITSQHIALVMDLLLVSAAPWNLHKGLRLLLQAFRLLETLRMAFRPCPFAQSLDLAIKLGYDLNDETSGHRTPESEELVERIFAESLAYKDTKELLERQGLNHNAHTYLKEI